MKRKNLSNFLVYSAGVGTAIAIFIGVELVPILFQPRDEPVKQFSKLSFDLNDLFISALGPKAYTGSVSDVVNLPIINKCVSKHKVYAGEYLSQSRTFIHKKEMAIGCFKTEAENSYLSKNLVNELLFDQPPFQRTYINGEWSASYSTKDVPNYLKYSDFVKLSTLKKQGQLTQAKVNELALSEAYNDE